MTTPQTILIGGWQVFAESRGLNKKEEPDTFAWLTSDLYQPQDQICYEDLRQAVAEVDGAREWLLNGLRSGPEAQAMEDAIADNASPNHSGASFTCGLNQYRLSLQRWDSWVLEIKTIYLKRSYKSRQVKPDRLRWFLTDTYHTFGVTEEEGIAQNLEQHKITFSDESVPKSWAELKLIVNPLMTEFKATAKAEEEWERLESAS